jgi:hypothetical protein
VDVFPTYPGWYAPGQITNVGAAVPTTKVSKPIVTRWVTTVKGAR